MFTVLRAFGAVPTGPNGASTRFSMVMALDFSASGHVTAAHLQVRGLEVAVGGGFAGTAAPAFRHPQRGGSSCAQVRCHLQEGANQESPLLSPAQTMLLERARVAQQPEGEGTFNVFSQMLAGLDLDQR